LGESQLSFNYVKAFSDYLVNFTFGKGVDFGSPEATQAIIPYLLKRVWDHDNDKQTLLWEIGQLGSVSGDVFVKVAYEEPFVDPSGRERAGKFRILPLNPAFCFPEWHPHDRNRLIRFKLKYKFWGTASDGARQVFTYTEILTEDTIEEYINDERIDIRQNPLGEIPIAYTQNKPVASSPWGLADITDIISLNREFNEKAAEVSDIINYHGCVDDQTEVLTASGWKTHTEVSDGDVILTINPVTDEIEWQEADFNRFDYDGDLVRWDNHIDALTTPNHRWLAERRVGRERRYEREMVRTAEGSGDEVAVGDLTQGSRLILGGGVPSEFPHEPKWSDELVETVGWYITEGSDHYSPNGWHSVHLSQKKQPHVDTIRRLAAYWNSEGGTFTESASTRSDGVVTWYLGKGVKEALEAAAPGKQLTPEFLCSLTYNQAKLLHQTLLDGDGTVRRREKVWYQDDLSRIDGYQMLCAMLGIRTSRRPSVVSEYARRSTFASHTVERASTEHYSGTVWCPTVANGTWFARRNGNTYWTGNSPVTVIIGAKASNLEKGPKKVWTIGSKDARIENLSMDTNFAGIMGYMELIKQSMHEMTGVPASALGQMQPISNTSGTALSVQFMPLMQHYGLKKTQYSRLFKRVNELIILHATIKEPETLQYNPFVCTTPPKPGQYIDLDPRDPVTYQSVVHWPEPLPVDVLIKINEIQAKMSMGLESKLGALRELGEMFADQKIAEINEEMVEDVKEAAALQLVQAQAAQFIIQATGMTPDGQPLIIPGMAGPDGEDGAPGAMAPSVDPVLAQEIMMRAYAQDPPQRETFED
jgi:hypothetical protein